MTALEKNHRREKMKDAIRLRAERRERHEEEGERPLWQNMSMIGALGWLIVVPTLLGVLAGRWLDSALGTGIQFTAALIFLGIIAGLWLAWRRMNHE